MQELKKLGHIPSSDMERKALLAPLAEAKREYAEIVMENTREAVRAGMERTIAELKKQGLGKSVRDNLMFYLNGSLTKQATEIDFESFSGEIYDSLKEQVFVASERTMERLTGDVMDLSLIHI